MHKTQTTRRHRTLLLTLIGCLLLGAGCSTTKTQNGVTIEKQRNLNLNPLSYIPYL